MCDGIPGELKVRKAAVRLEASKSLLILLYAGMAKVHAIMVIVGAIHSEFLLVIRVIAGVTHMGRTTIRKQLEYPLGWNSLPPPFMPPCEGTARAVV